MKLRSFFYVLAAGAIAMLLVAAGGFYWLTAQSPLQLLYQGATVPPAATIFIPKRSPAAVSLLANPEQLEALAVLATVPSQRRQVKSEIQQIKAGLAAAGLDYDRDIQPWLGDEITLALTSLDLDRDRQNLLQPGYLLVVTTKNPQKSQAFIDSFWRQQAVNSADLISERYRGVRLTYSQKNLLSTAVAGDRFLLFANHPKVLRDAIANAQVADLNLQANTDYQRAWQKIDRSKIGFAFINLSALSNSDLESQSLAAGLSIHRQGILIPSALMANKGEANIPQVIKPIGALYSVPAGSSLALAGNNLQQLWANLQPEDIFGRCLKKAIAIAQTRWQIDLPEDIFSWVQGEYALALLPNADRQEPDWIFVAERTAAADDAIAHLDALAKQQGLSQENLTLTAGQNAISWTKLPAANANLKKLTAASPQIQGVHITSGNYEIFATSIAAMNRVLQGPYNSLGASSEFQNAIAPLRLPNNGYLYLDWQGSQSILKRQFPLIQLAELVGKPLFAKLRSLSFTSYDSDSNLRQGKLFLKFSNKQSS